MTFSVNEVGNELAGVDAGGAGACEDPARRHWRRTRLMAVSAVFLAVAGLAACGNSGNDKTYDIAPIFPLSADKCAQYDGTAEGSGLDSHCWVTKDECEKAAADWRVAMQDSYVSDPIEFTC